MATPINRASFSAMALAALMLAVFAYALTLSATDIETGVIVEVDRAESGLAYTYYYYVPAGVQPGTTNPLLHIATASPPLASVSEADNWALGQLEHFILGGFLDDARLIAFTVAVPQSVKGNRMSGFAAGLSGANFDSTQTSGIFLRPDLHFIDALDHFKEVLRHAGYGVEERILLTGFSSGGNWAHKFTFLHPSLIRAVAPGGTANWTMPLREYQGERLSWPMGVSSLPTNEPFRLELLRDVPFYVFLGADDTNDAFREVPPGSGTCGFSGEQVSLYEQLFGTTPQQKARAFVENLVRQGVSCVFREYAHTGHTLTAEMKRDVIDFFMDVLGRDSVYESEARVTPDPRQAGLLHVPTGFTGMQIKCDGFPGEDWTSTSPVFSDPSGDTLVAGADITSVYAFTDSQYLYLRVDFADGAPVASMNSSPGAILYSINLESSDWGRGVQYAVQNHYSFAVPSLYTQDGPRPIAMSIGEVIEAVVPLALLGRPSSVRMLVETRPMTGKWAERFDDTGWHVVNLVR